MRAFIFSLTTLMVMSCGGNRENERPVLSQVIASSAKKTWEASTKPISVIVENAPAWLDEVGVSFVPDDATVNETMLLSNMTYKKTGGRFLPADEKAITSDTVSKLTVFYPAYPEIEDNRAEFEAPFSEHLYGEEVSRAIDSLTLKEYAFESRVRLHSSMSMLEVRIESDNIKDILESISISGEQVPQKGVYDCHTGVWSDIKRGGRFTALAPGCLLNNGRLHEIHLIPFERESEVFLIPKISGKDYAVRVRLSPMSPGSLIRLNLAKKGESVSITGSWITQNRPMSSRPNSAKKAENIKVGSYMRADGSFTAQRDSLSIAVVVETDGVHGKAVYLTDCPGEYTYGEKQMTSGRYFADIDGSRHQGVINPTKAENIPPEHRIIVLPEKRFAASAALSHTDGAETTSVILQKYRESTAADTGNGTMLREIDKHPGCYVPSLGEMAELYLMFRPASNDAPTELLEMPQGNYLTCTEADHGHIYTLDFGQGSINGGSPKMYSKARLRMFCLF